MYLGQYLNRDVWAIQHPAGLVILVQFPSERVPLAYPIDLHDTFREWVNERVLLGGAYSMN